MDMRERVSRFVCFRWRARRQNQPLFKSDLLSLQPYSYALLTFADVSAGLPPLPRASSMAPKKRARTAASASSSSPPTATPTLTLRGGVPHHPSLAGLWRAERLTDFTVCTEGVEFKTHRVALASSSKYFLNLFESGMRDAADATHALEGIRSKALEALLAFIYEGKCEIDEGQLTEVLEASARLVVDTLKEACAHAIGARLAPSNVLNV